jgi:hypothetical protein
MPNTQALQVFYGSIPFMLVLVAIYFRNETILRDILARLTNIETTLRDWMPKVERRLTTLETRAGVIYHE